jgi:hypothetical protein
LIASSSGIDARHGHVILILGQLADIAAVVILTALGDEAVEQVEELHVCELHAADVFHGEGLIHDIAVAVHREGAPAAEAGFTPIGVPVTVSTISKRRVISRSPLEITD